MGATGWKYFVPYEADLASALHRLREKVFASGKYLSGTGVSEADFDSALKQLNTTRESTVAQLARFAEDPAMPAQVREEYAKLCRQIKERQIEQQSETTKPVSIDQLREQQAETGTHSILDVTHISSTPEFGAIIPLPTSALVSLFETGKPSRAEIESRYASGSLDRYYQDGWQGICIVVYLNNNPREIFFAGKSGD